MEIAAFKRAYPFYSSNQPDSSWSLQAGGAASGRRGMVFPEADQATPGGVLAYKLGTLTTNSANASNLPPGSKRRTELVRS